MSERPVQYFTDEYLERCRSLSPLEILTFLDQFRTVAYAGKKQKSKLISMKVPEDLLGAFKFKARMQGRPYQAVIKDLMTDWLLDKAGP